MARVINKTRGSVLGRKVEVVRTFARRFLGLIGRRDWGEETDGMWIEPCTGVHGFGMVFPIDVVLVDDGMTALWTQTLAPWRVGKIHLDAQAAIELPKGTIEKTGTCRGDVLELHEGHEISS